MCDVDSICAAFAADYRVYYPDGRPFCVFATSDVDVAIALLEDERVYIDVRTRVFVFDRSFYEAFEKLRESVEGSDTCRLMVIDRGETVHVYYVCILVAPCVDVVRLLRTYVGVVGAFGNVISRHYELAHL